MKSIIDWLLETGDFMSHGNCYLWNPALVRLHVTSDLLIGIAYAAIPITLLTLVRRARHQMPFHWMIIAFGGFIIACGCTHLIEVWTIWTPVYWFSGGVKALTAALSVTTAIALPGLVPKSLALIQSGKTAEDRRIELERANLALRNEVTERERAEAAVRKLNEELEQRVQSRTAQLAEANEQLAEIAAIVSHSNDAIFSQTLDGVITSWNPGAERMYGYSSEIIGRHASILVPEERMAEREAVMERIARGELLDSFDTLRVRKDGVLIDVHLTISPVRDAADQVRGASVIARDVTDSRKADQRLRETQKLESLGLIAGGVAHDFNNLLVGIMGNSSLALESMTESDPNVQLLEQVLVASEKASHLTRQMLAYAGKGKFIAEKINISALVREIGILLQVSIPKLVELQLVLEQDLPAIEGDPSQIQQLIMNLLINAAEAIGDDRVGTVVVSTETREVDEAYIQDNYAGEPIMPGTYVALEVHDTGCGMDEETRSRIFDPFFTTKFTGRGLGLAAALGIVRGHRGTIRVYSTPGNGSTFKVLLPSADGRPAPPMPVEVQQELRGTGTVLVVDDEAVVRSMARATLERFGYKVLTAIQGEDGVELFRERADEISVVLLDLTMPVMSGQEAFRQIRAIRPNARVVVSSGYNEVEAIRRFTTSGIAAFIQKPYTAVKLAKVVKQALSNL